MTDPPGVWVTYTVHPQVRVVARSTKAAQPVLELAGAAAAVPIASPFNNDGFTGDASPHVGNGIAGHMSGGACGLVSDPHGSASGALTDGWLLLW